ncbi:hypothetical protein, partial [Prosthecomicrobium hirschii]|uniref:hypothetical protein n=1 Tax=Prosthecodimorpha hirschii TaxID=665126 RepID=UPI0006C77A69
LDRGFVQQDALYLQPLDTIEIGDHRFEVHPVGQPAIVCENPSCQVLNEYDRGDNCRLCGTRLFDATRLADKLALIFYYDESEPTFAVLSNPERLQVYLDRGFVQQDALYLQPLDTIEIGDHRFEVHPVGQPAIVCENPSCQVLNEYDRGDNCRLCGTRLFGATRIVRGKT